METSWVFEKLQELLVLDETLCTSLMKQVRNVLLSTHCDRVIIYDVTSDYASLFLTNQQGTIYFYKNLQCSKVKPITKRFTTSLSSIVNQFTSIKTKSLSFNSKWITNILEMDHQARYRSDNDLLELNIPLNNKIIPIISTNVDHISTTPSITSITLHEQEKIHQMNSPETLSTTSSLPSIKIYEPEIIEKRIPKSIFVSLEEDDKISVKSTSSTNSTNTRTSKYNYTQPPPPLYRKPSKPIPLELRPKWKR